MARARVRGWGTGGGGWQCGWGRPPAHPEGAARRVAAAWAGAAAARDAAMAVAAAGGCSSRALIAAGGHDDGGAAWQRPYYYYGRVAAPLRGGRWSTFPYPLPPPRPSPVLPPTRVRLQRWCPSAVPFPAPPIPLVLSAHVTADRLLPPLVPLTTPVPSASLPPSRPPFFFLFFPFFNFVLPVRRPPLSCPSVWDGGSVGGGWWWGEAAVDGEGRCGLRSVGCTRAHGGRPPPPSPRPRLPL